MANLKLKRRLLNTGYHIYRLVIEISLLNKNYDLIIHFVNTHFTCACVFRRLQFNKSKTIKN